MMKRDTPQSGIILPSAMFAQRLLAIERIYAAELGLSPYLLAFTLEDAQRVIRAVYEDLISARLSWAHETDNVSLTMESILEKRGVFDGPSYEQVRSMMLSAWRQALDEILEIISSHIAQIVPMNSWYLWTLETFMNDLLLERGEDYRVMEWERMMAERDQERRDNDVIDAGTEVSGFVRSHETWALRSTPSVVKDNEHTVYVPWLVTPENLQILDGRLYRENGRLLRFDADQAERLGLIDKLIVLRVDQTNIGKPGLPLLLSHVKPRTKTRGTGMLTILGKADQQVVPDPPPAEFRE